MPQVWSDSFISEKGAEFSPCRQYRYVLWRKWDDRIAPMVFIMLNPSTADAEKDDKTISMCCRFAQREKSGGILVVNLFAFRSTDWTTVLKISDRAGSDNALWIERVCRLASKVVVAWGSKPIFKQEATSMKQYLLTKGIALFCLGKNKDGSPKHPSRLALSTCLIPWM